MPHGKNTDLASNTPVRLLVLTDAGECMVKVLTSCMLLLVRKAMTGLWANSVKLCPGTSQSVCPKSTKSVNGLLQMFLALESVFNFLIPCIAACS